MRKNKSSAKPATLPLFALDKTSKASIIRNRKSAADERLALSITQRSWAESLGEGGSLLFMFTITKQFDQRNNNQCQLAQIAKVQLELHKRHPSLRAGLRDFFISRNVPSHGTPKCIWGLNRPPLWQHPNHVLQFVFILPEISFSGKIFIHTEKMATLPVFPHQFNSSKCKQQFIIFSNNITRVPVR